MKKTNRALLIILISISMICVFLFSSCSKASGVKIDAFEKELEWKFTKTQTNNGYNFSYEDSSSNYNISCSGVADKQENVSSITITNKDVDTSILTNQSSLQNSMSKTSGQMTRSDLKALKCVTEVTAIMKAAGRDLSSITVNEAISEFNSLFNGKPITYEKWTITASVNQSAGQVVIEAKYK